MHEACLLDLPCLKIQCDSARASICATDPDYDELADSIFNILVFIVVVVTGVAIPD